ncbi:hypothetical protein [Virgibacillus sp. L01]|uniref:hypothetical protein n=1 Tax=Virgibacillus sp. L01 TaxID=3457429 RepID=UPI003FD5F1F2
MEIQLLVIGHRSILEKVESIAKEIPQISIITVTDHPGIGETLKNLSSKQIDGVIVVNPLLGTKEVSQFFMGTPVFYMKNSNVSFYTTLFRCLFNNSGTSIAQCNLSVDYYNEQDIRKQLHEEDITIETLKIIEYEPSMKAEDLIAFHKRSWQVDKVQAVITCHPNVYESLRAHRVNTYLFMPTYACLKSYMTTITSKVTNYYKSSKATTFPIRYEKDDSLLKQIGMSGATIHRLFCFCESIGSNKITTTELANGFSITLRSARRILNTLEDHRIAEVIGEEQVKGRGRPRYVYHIDFNQFSNDFSSIANLESLLV